MQNEPTSPDTQVIAWLMQGDVAIRWQTMRDLLAAPAEEWQAERQKVATSGWAARLLSHQDSSGRWGGGVYSPKWTSTIYTLLQWRPSLFKMSNWGQKAASALGKNYAAATCLLSASYCRSPPISA